MHNDRLVKFVYQRRKRIIGLRTQVSRRRDSKVWRKERGEVRRLNRKNHWQVGLTEISFTNRNETIIFKILPGYDCLSYQTRSPQKQIKPGVQPLPVKRNNHLSITDYTVWSVIGSNHNIRNVRGSLNCVIHGVGHAYPHCEGSERDHLIQNEWLCTKEKGGNKCQIQGEQLHKIVKAGQVISIVARKITISLPWKKFVLPDPLAPTAKKIASK